MYSMHTALDVTGTGKVLFQIPWNSGKVELLLFVLGGEQSIRDTVHNVGSRYKESPTSIDNVEAFF